MIRPSRSQPRLLGVRWFPAGSVLLCLLLCSFPGWASGIPQEDLERLQGRDRTGPGQPSAPPPEAESLDPLQGMIPVPRDEGMGEGRGVQAYPDAQPLVRGAPEGRPGEPEQGVEPPADMLPVSPARRVPAVSRVPKEVQGSKPALPAIEPGRPGRGPPRMSGDPEAGFVTGAFGMKAFVYRYPEERLREPWLECRLALERGSLPELKTSLNRLYEARLDTGFPNAPGVAAVLVRDGYRAMERGDLEMARLVGHSARDLAPDFFPVYRFLSRLAIRDDSVGWGQALLSRGESLQQRWRLFPWQHASAGRLSLLLLLSCFLFFLLMGVCFLGRYGKPFLHALREQATPGLHGGLQVVVLCILGVMVLLLLPGPLWGVVILGVLLGRWLTRSEQTLFLTGLLLLALAPMILREAGRLTTQPVAVRVLCECIQGDWDASCDRDLEMALGTNPESADLLLVRALVEKRRGEVVQAATILQEALRLHPENGSIWNNKGNLLAFQGDLPAAKDAYAHAIRWNPGIASPHHNLSQLLRREFSFLEGGRAFQKARRMDPARVDFFSYIHSPNPNRFFMDESPSVGTCWRHALTGNADAGAVPDSLWVVAASGIPLSWAPWVFGPLAVLTAVLAFRRRRSHVPRACTGCGVIVCEKCHSGTAMTRMCTPCYQVLYAGKEVPKARRTLQVRKMVRYRSARFLRLMLLNGLLPGIGFSLYEDRVRGYLLLFLFLFLAVAALFWVRLLPLPVVAWEVGRLATSPASLVLGGVLLGLYAAVQVRFYRKIRFGR